MSGALNILRSALIGSCLLLFASAVPVEDCDRAKCKGPVKFYEDLGCKAVYENEGDCCAIRYDCSHLTTNKSPDKCYINGHEYSLGEKLRDEDRSSPCDECTCAQGSRSQAEFRCVVFDCFNQWNLKDGCYFKRDSKSCCGGEEICPQSPEERYKCEVDGKIVLEGHGFYPKSNPEVYCECSKGYKGENIEPFCKPIKCGMELRRSYELTNNCTPVFYASQSTRFSCYAFGFRCQNERDVVIPAAGQKLPEDLKNIPDEMKCKFGNMTMNIGDELNESTDHSSACTKCICEVPPMPTCQRAAECNVKIKN